MKPAIGVDPGSARVGLAVSDDLGLLAHPLETIEVRSLSRPGGAAGPAAHPPETALAARIAEAAARRGAATIVVGIPFNMNGSAGPSAQAARALAAALRALGRFEIIEWDERMTTLAAQRQFREAGRSGKKSRRQIDQAAAVLILQSWLDARQLRSGNLL